MGLVWLGAVLYKMGKFRVLYRKPQPNTTAHNNQHEPPPPYPPVALPSLSPWVEQWHHKPWRLLSPTPYAGREPSGLRSLPLVCSLGGGEMRGIKNRERGVCCGLRWLPFYKLHPTIKQKSASAMEGESRRMRDRAERVGGRRIFALVVECIDEN
jgi:hypothetical protein